MTYKKSFLLALPVLASMTFSSSPASALVVVNVDLRNARVLNNIANNLQVAVSNVPITVQAPVNVCGAGLRRNRERSSHFLRERRRYLHCLPVEPRSEPDRTEGDQPQWAPSPLP